MTFLMFFFWIGFSVAIGVAAFVRCNRNGFGWAILSLAISPLLAGAFLLAVGPKRAAQPQGPTLSVLPQSRTELWIGGTFAAIIIFLVVATVVFGIMFNS